MTLIDGDRIITAQLYDDEREEFTEKKLSIIEYINAYTDEGITEADVVAQTDVPDTNVGDLISRHAAKRKAVYSHERHEKVVPVAELDWLPSIESERKTGKWVDGKCNKCGANAPFWPMATTYYCSDFCPNCGCHMIAPQESEDKA